MGSKEGVAMGVAGGTVIASENGISSSSPSVDYHKDENEDEEDDDEDRPLNYYAGGIKSGQMIQDPNKRNKKDLVNQMIEKARQQGQNPLEPLQQGETKFTGAGYRLGNNAVEPTVPIVNNTTPQKSANRTLIFWRNGFQIDNGPLRPYDDPANQQFLTDIKNGIVPKELNIQSDIDINLIDHKRDDYVAPKQKIYAFTGSGYSLGSSTPITTTTPTATPISTPISTPVIIPGPSESNMVLQLDQPQTTIQIRLADGTRLVSKFNLTHTIQDIINFVGHAKHTHGFRLLTTFPQKVLDQPNQTIVEAGLQNAVIVQQLL